MIVVPAGQFQMGMVPGDVSNHNDEKPAQEISVSKFAIGMTEVTVREFNAFVKENSELFNYSDQCWAPDIETGAWGDQDRYVVEQYYTGSNGFDSARYPVVCINHLDAQSYIEWLNSKVDGDPYRLPSESEMEYVIRAGSETVYAWGDKLTNEVCEFANGPDKHLERNYNWSTFLVERSDCFDDFPALAPVAYYSKNAFGLYDTIGNVSEWTADCYEQGLLGIPLDGGARITDDCSRNSVRGGSWAMDSPRYMRSSFRRGKYSAEENVSIGFRVARDLK